MMVVDVISSLPVILVLVIVALEIMVIEEIHDNPLFDKLSVVIDVDLFGEDSGEVLCPVGFGELLFIQAL